MDQSNSKTLIKDILKDTLSKVLEDSKVPYSVHLAVIKKLEATLKAHRDDLASQQSDYLKQFNNFEKLIKECARELERRKIEKGDDGYTPIKGVDYFDGKDAYVDIDAIVSVILSKIQPQEQTPIPTIEEIIEAMPPQKNIDEESLAKSIVTLIKKKKLLSSGDINGMQGFSRDGINYRFEELMHGGGGSGGGSITYSYDLSSQCNGVNKVFTVPSNTNFVLLTGTDAPIVYKLGTDYTGSGTVTLTLTSQVNAPSTGATLILTYIV